MKRKLAYLLIGALILWLMACQPQGKLDNALPIAANKPDKLVVYSSAPSNTFVSGKTGEELFTYYPSESMIGSILTGGELESPRGNIFEQALKEYEEQTGIAIEVHYVEEYVGESDMFQQMLDDGKALPDLMLFTKHSRYDYEQIVERDLFLDFTPYMMEESVLPDEEKYYQAVLNGGCIDQKQYALPVLFNLNGLITRGSYLDYIGVGLLSERPSFEEILQLLQQSCVEMEGENLIEAVVEKSGDLAAGQYIPSILLGAAYPEYYDTKKEALIISEEFIQDILEFMQAFYRQEFATIEGWQDNDYLSNVNSTRNKWYLTAIDDPAEYEKWGIFLTGGRGGSVQRHNSLLTDLAFYQTIYQEHGEELVFRGIPTVEDNQGYAANITVYAFGANTTEYPEEVYKLARYLMDYTYPIVYGFSVNKEITEKQLTDMQSTTLKIYPAELWTRVMGNYNTVEEIEDQVFWVDPLSEELTAEVRYMLDHMVGAGLPNTVIEYQFMRYALNKMGNKEMTAAETARWFYEEIMEYRRIRGDLKPFYDREYVFSYLE